MPHVYFKLVPLAVCFGLLFYAFRAHERFWSLGFSGWKKMYLGLLCLFCGSIVGILFEFAELRRWQEALDIPVDWLLVGLFFSIGAGLILWSSVERLSHTAQEKDELEAQKEAFELFDGIREAAQGPYSFLEILNYSLKEIIRRVDADAGAIWLTHPSGKQYILACASGYSLILQQKLESISTAHHGFARLADGRTAHEINGEKSVQRWFPEFFTPDERYGSLIGMPLTVAYGGKRQREPLGMMLICTHHPGSLSATDARLIGSAVAFLAATVAEAKTSRLLRRERRAHERLEHAQRDFTDWLAEVSAQAQPRRRLQTAISGLSDWAGAFVGCGRYHAEDDRWEPLAMAAANDDEQMLGQAAFRDAAALAIREGRETTFRVSPIEANQGTSYRMLPVGLSDDPDDRSAVLFLPVNGELPLWWDSAIIIVTEITRTTLLLDRPLRRSPESALAGIQQSPVGGIDQPTEIPTTAAGTNDDRQAAMTPELVEWERLTRLIPNGSGKRFDEIAAQLAAVLPDGWRAALWQAVENEYHLRLAAAKDTAPVYYDGPELPYSPTADRVEFDAHLGGMAQVTCPADSVLRDHWPDFGEGWRGWRFAALFGPDSRGWITFYQAADRPFPDETELRFLRSLSGILELLISRLDSAEAGYIVENETGINPDEKSAPATRIKPRVLVVDDQDLIRDVLLGMLDVLGFGATAARSLEEGLAQLADESFDTVITSHALPHQTADELAEHVKRQHPDTRVIMIESPDTAEKSYSGGLWADSVLTKPFRIDDLRALLTPVQPDRVSE